MFSDFLNDYTKCIIKGDREKVKLTEDIIRKIIKNYDDEEPDPEELSYEEKIKFLTVCYLKKRVKNLRAS